MATMRKWGFTQSHKMLRLMMVNANICQQSPRPFRLGGEKTNENYFSSLYKAMEHSRLEFLVLWPLHFGRRDIYKLVLGSRPRFMDY